MAQTAPPASAMPADQTWSLCRCVMLVGKSLSHPHRLVEGLRQRGVEVRLAADPPGVMVEMAAHMPQVLIVHEPKAVRRLSELMAAVRSYYPQTACWQYQGDANGQEGRLTRIGEDLSQPPAQPSPSLSSMLSMPRPSLSPTSAANDPSSEEMQESSSSTSPEPVAKVDSHASPQDQPSDAAIDPSLSDFPAIEQAASSALLTQEELEMLLGPAISSKEQETDSDFASVSGEELPDVAAAGRKAGRFRGRLRGKAKGKPEEGEGQGL